MKRLKTRLVATPSNCNIRACCIKVRIFLSSSKTREEGWFSCFTLPVSEKEVEFYSTIRDKDPEFVQWIAGYHGVKEVNQNGINGKFMIIDDLTYPYRQPSVVDLKMGVKTWEDDAPTEKIERESKKYPLQRKIGFRLTGMRVFNPEKQDFDIYGKDYGYSLTEETLPNLFTNFFSFVKAEFRQTVIRSVIQQLESILDWFENRGHLQFICTSVLIIFEGDTESDYHPIVRLVDFAHMKQLAADQRDEGFIVGLKWILNDLKKRVEQ